MLFMAAADVLVWIQSIANGLALAAQGVQLGLMISLLNNITNGAWILEQARKFCIEFDQILIQYSDKIYGYFVEIVGGTIVTSEILDGLMSRIYIIVGIFIFFKLIIVSIRYMVSPEQFTDDKVGAQTLVKRVIIGSIIILFIPTIFSTANRLQRAIIKDRVIEKIVLPEDIYQDVVKTRNPGRDMAMLVFNGFFSWNDAIDPNSAKKVYNSYNKVKVYNDLTLFNKKYINEQKNNDIYVINYVPLISTLATGYLLFMLISYTIEVAFRSFKLMILQLLSPFVIVNYMLDTTKEEVMKKWLNSTIATYLLIFIRVMSIWLTTLLAYYLTNGVDGESVLNTPDPLLKSIIVIAIFAFLKDLPKLISEIFGYNLQENETISGVMNQGVNVLKGFAMGKVAKGITSGQMITSAIGSGASAVGSAAGGGIKGKQLADNMKLGKGSTGASIFAGIGVGAGNGMSATTSMLGSTTASIAGQTFMSPVAQTASAASHMASPDPRANDWQSSSSGKENESTNASAKINNNANVFNNMQEIKEISQQSENQFINSLQTDSRFENYVSGSSFNLSNSINNGVTVTDNPVINAMSEKIYQDLGSPKEINANDIAIKLDNHLYSEDSKVSNPNLVSSTEIRSLMDDVKKDISSSINKTEVLDFDTKVSNIANQDAKSDLKNN